MGIYQFHQSASIFLKYALFISLTHLLFVSPKSATAQQAGRDDRALITLTDFQALQAIKLEFIDPRKTLKSWNGSRNGACSGSWAGIKCSKGQIIALQLPFKALSGRISLKIGLLKGLRKLSLHDNLIGGTIPSSIGSLPNLRGLYLFNNRFSGSIPPSIGSSSQIQALDLSNNLLVGSIPSTLVSSPRVYRVNLSFNSLSGSIPPGFALSPSLTFLALEHNNLSGPVPGSWGSKGGNGVYQLRSLTLDHNSLVGTIPSSIGNLSHITLLDLSQNNFSGEIPTSIENLSNLTSFNVSHNSLSGQVPLHLAKKFNSSSFVGNLQLCGFSASIPCASPPPMSLGEAPSPSLEPKATHHRKLSTKDIILIVVGSLLAILLVLCCVLLCCLIRKRAGSKAKNGGKRAGMEKGLASVGGAGAGGAGGEAGNNGGKLVLFDGPFVFTADDLLCATAEIMGKSPFGTVYKATLEDGTQVTVKRLREKLAKSPKEFEIEVAALGRLRHPNLLPLRAYYLGPKGEKLLVFDYLTKGSLSSFLHARGPEITIDWPTRMKIAIGITRGLTHLHNQDNLVHGNLTSSDIYLDEKNNPKIGDYGIHRLMTESANTNVIATAGSTGYHAPELLKTKKPTIKTDIYSLGVIILELLTGKSPSEAIEGSDLPQWVASTVKEEWTNVVFDLDLMRDVSAAGDNMLNTLKLALHLVDPSPDSRPDAQQVVQQLEEINRQIAAELATEESAEKSHH